MAAAAASSRSLAAACVVAVLLVGCLAADADARRLLLDDKAMPPTMADDMGTDMMSPAQAPAPVSGADDYLAGRMLFHGRGLLDGGVRLAGRLLIGLGL